MPANPIRNMFDVMNRRAIDAAKAKKAASAEGQLTAAGQRSGEIGERMTDEYTKRALDFDPNEAYDKYMSGATNQFGELLDTRLKTLAGRSVGAGRLDTGFFDLDQGDVVRSVAQDFSNTASNAALDVSGQVMSNNNSIGNYGLQREGMAMDVLSGNADREMMRENARREEKARKRGGIGGLIGGALGGVGGFLIGGPAGAFAGFNAGSRVGSAI